MCRECLGFSTIWVWKYTTTWPGRSQVSAQWWRKCTQMLLYEMPGARRSGKRGRKPRMREYLVAAPLIKWERALIRKPALLSGSLHCNASKPRLPQSPLGTQDEDWSELSNSGNWKKSLSVHCYKVGTSCLSNLLLHIICSQGRVWMLLEYNIYMFSLWSASSTL